jgi:hypothetical protein
MEIRIVIDAPKGWRRRVLLLGGALVGLIGVPAVIAHAYDTSWIVSGGPVSASSLAANLNEAQSRIAALESFRATVTADGGYPVGATYCGVTASVVTGGGIGGYAAARSLCQTASGCNSTAHMCTGDELARSVALGHSPTVVGSGGGWYASGSYSPGGANPATDDCNGWLEGASNFWGACWVYNPGNNQNGPSACSCASSVPVICCE